MLAYVNMSKIYVGYWNCVIYISIWNKNKQLSYNVNICAAYTVHYWVIDSVYCVDNKYKL